MTGLNPGGFISDVMIVKPMDKSHLDSVIEIEQGSFLHPWNRDSFLHGLKHGYGRNFIVSIGPSKSLDPGLARVAGYACFNIVADEFHLLKIAIHPEMRKRNIGYHFLARCFSDAAQEALACVLLEVRRSNKAAYNLYLKLGFDIIAIRPEYYLLKTGNREDALIMRKILKGGSTWQ
jgi:[ribosomal protein S18]-alanine N-acetyltransferase